MDNNCWYRINIDTKNALNGTLKFKNPEESRGTWNPPAKAIFNQDWLSFMSAMGLPIVSSMVFYRGPFAGTKDAHIDLTKVDPLRITNFGLNFCKGGKDSEMVWYKLPEKLPEPKYTAPGAPYMSWDLNELEEIDRCHIGEELTLVRTDYPHSIVMQTEPRWCISARPFMKDDIPWDDAVKFFKDKNLLIER